LDKTLESPLDCKVIKPVNLKGNQSFLAVGSFLMSQPFTSGGQRTGASASSSALPVNNQD